MRKIPKDGPRQGHEEISTRSERVHYGMGEKRMKIQVAKSATADTRTCDWSKVTKEELLNSSIQHIQDVSKGIEFFNHLLHQAGVAHDRTKISKIDEFYADFKTGFSKTDWWKMHQEEERHHFNTTALIQDDVNLIDVLEQIVDGVMAGMARSGKYRMEPLSNELLQKAYANTAKKLIEAVEIVDSLEEKSPGFLRGASDCTMDACENVPLGSLGPDRNSTPAWVPEVEKSDWMEGYCKRAKEMYGPNWREAKFEWIPTMEINK